MLNLADTLNSEQDGVFAFGKDISSTLKDDTTKYEFKRDSAASQLQVKMFNKGKPYHTGYEYSQITLTCGVPVNMQNDISVRIDKNGPTVNNMFLAPDMWTVYSNSGSVTQTYLSALNAFATWHGKGAWEIGYRYDNGIPGIKYKSIKTVAPIKHITYELTNCIALPESDISVKLNDQARIALSASPEYSMFDCEYETSGVVRHVEDKTFVTTEQYGIMDDVIVRAKAFNVQMDETVITSDYMPAGAKFEFGPFASALDNDGQICLSIDGSGCKSKNEMIFTIGNNISTWNELEGYRVHAYYTKSTGLLELDFLGKKASSTTYYCKTQKTISGTTSLDVKLTSKSVTVNGSTAGDTADGWKIVTGSGSEKKNIAIVLSGIAALDGVSIGSAEGSTRSNATYSRISLVKPGAIEMSIDA